MNELTTALPTRNRPQLLRLTLKSLATQVRKPDRVVVLDNGSPEPTAEVLQEFSGVLPIEHCPSPSPLSWNENHNRGVALAEQTCYLHFLHDDDLILPEFYSTALSRLSAASGKALFYCPCEFIDGQGDVFARDFSVKDAHLTPREFIYERAYLSPIYIPSIVLRTNYQRSHCTFTTEFKQTADIIFWVDWVRQCSDVFRSSSYLAQYRKHSGAETASNIKQVEMFIDEEWKTINYISQILEESFSFKFGWLERQKLKCLIAARAQMGSGLQEERLRANLHIKNQFGLLFSVLGRCAATVRKALYPRR